MAKPLSTWPLWKFLLFSNKTPRWAKWLVVAGLLYGISPLDLVPDFIPLLGQIDDIGVIIAALMTFWNATAGLRRDIKKDPSIIDVEMVKP